MKCINCKKSIPDSLNIGTMNRNHCPYCLFSQHLDQSTPGDRKSKCYGKMKPVALTFKKAKRDKYGKEKQGEIMIVHKCEECNKYSVNRIAGDDDPTEILNVFKDSVENHIDVPNNIKILTAKDKKEMERQLFGE